MPEFLHIAWATFLIILFFGGSIFVHEFGHYIAARRRGLKVDRFSIGFGPRLFSWNRDGVEWCVSLFPLGGYVALPQLANLEGLEGDYKSDPKKLPPISYTDTLVVAVMGVVFNIIFAFALATILWGVGRPSTDSQQTTVVGTVLEKITDAKGTEVTGPGLSAGIQSGDKILSIDGVQVKNWRDVKQFIVTGLGRDAKHQPSLTMVVRREGNTVTLSAQPILSGPEKLRSLGLLPQEDLFVGQIFKDSPAQRTGVKTGDQILSINTHPIRTYYDYDKLLRENGLNPLQLKILRDKIEQTFTIAPRKVKISQDGQEQALLGFSLEPKIITVYQNPIEQIVGAASLTWRTLTTLVHPDSDIKLSHLSGPPGIAWAIYRLSTDFRQVLSFIVLINVNLAILNLLPLPVLDGGHIVLATINKFRRKPLPVTYIIVLQNIFTVALLGLMIYVIFFSDVPRLGREWKDVMQERKESKLMITPDFSK